MRIGVLGGGQLGRMLGLAGIPLGHHFRFLDPSPTCPASQVGEIVVGKFDDPVIVDRFAEGLDVVTYEFENVPASTVRRLAKGVAVRPGVGSLEVSQDRILEKEFFRACGLPIQRFAGLEKSQDAECVVREIGVPCVLKTRRMGYDGKGQCVIRAIEDAKQAFARMGEVPCIVEEFVSFDREVSLAAVRSLDGTISFLPSAVNVHRDGILRTSVAPAFAEFKSGEILEACLQGHLRVILDRLEHVGVLTVEFFQLGNRFIANEMAPRVHNSVHWSIEACRSSQFEQHIRAVSGWPLGDSSLECPAGMVNLIGALPDASAILGVPFSSLHLYDKAPRPGRKLGHVTLTAPTIHEIALGINTILGMLPPDA